MSGPGKVHFLRPGFTVNGRTIPARTSCGRDPEQVRAGRHPTCGQLNSKRWRPATGRNPPIEAWSQPTPWGHASRVPGRGLAGGGGAFPAPLDPPSGEAVGAQAGMDTLYHSIYSDPGGPVNRCGTTVCVPARSGRFRSCPQLCPNKESTTFRRRGLTPVFERLFREAVGAGGRARDGPSSPGRWGDGRQGGGTGALVRPASRRTACTTRGSQGSPSRRPRSGLSGPTPGTCRPTVRTGQP